MGWIVLSNSGKTNYNIKEYVCDSLEDLPVDTIEASLGSTAYVTSEQKTYMLNSQKEWVEVKSNGGGGGGGDSPIPLPINGTPVLQDGRVRSITFDGYKLNSTLTSPNFTLGIISIPIVMPANTNTLLVKYDLAGPTYYDTQYPASIYFTDSQVTNYNTKTSTYGNKTLLMANLPSGEYSRGHSAFISVPKSASYFNIYFGRSAFENIEIFAFKTEEFYLLPIQWEKYTLKTEANRPTVEVSEDGYSLTSICTGTAKNVGNICVPLNIPDNAYAIIFKYDIAENSTYTTDAWKPRIYGSTTEITSATNTSGNVGISVELLQSATPINNLCFAVSCLGFKYFNLQFGRTNFENARIYYLIDNKIQ